MKKENNLQEKSHPSLQGLGASSFSPLGVGGFKSPNIFGYYGNFVGAYIPEMLHRNVEELRNNYINIMYDAAFQKEFHELLRDYVGRPTPLYLAKRLSNLHNTNIHLKREDLYHTGAH